MELTKEQSEALQRQPDAQLELVDPVTNRHYVLLPVEVLVKLREEAEDAQHARAWLKATQQGMALALEEPE